jgi:hypothetical protein
MNEKMKSFLVVAILLMAGLLFLLCLPTGNVAGATTRFVGASGSTYTTIQDAIDDAQEQDMIVIEDGTYTENLDFSTITAGPLTELIIMGNGSVTIDGSAATIIPLDGGDVSMLILAELILTNGGTNAITIQNAGIIATINVNIGTPLIADTSALRECYFQTFEVLYMDGTTPIEDADLMLDTDGDLEYATDYYDPGSLNATTDVDGKIYDVVVANARHLNSGVVYHNNVVYAYKNEDAAHEEMLIIADTNATGTIQVTFSADVRAPVALENVTATTVDQTSIQVTWNATVEPSFLNYTVYETDSMGGSKVKLGNTTNEYYNVTGLAPSTQYYFVATVTDDAGLESPDSAVATNTTLDPINGTVSGTAKFGPITRGVGGGADREIYVALLNATADEIVNTTVNETEYNYTFTGVLFQANLSVWAEPVDDADKGAVGVSSGWLPDQSDEFVLSLSNLAQAEDLELPWYEYVPPLPILSGKVTYEDTGENATGCTVQLLQYNETGVMSYIANGTANDTTGNYTFIDVLDGKNYTVKVTPEADMLGEMDVKDGYLPKETDMFNVTMDKTMDVELEYYDYEPWAKVTGQVQYTGGDNDPRNATNLTVEVYQTLMEVVDDNWTENKTLKASVTTNDTGFYVIDGEPGINYTVMVTPATDDLYINGTQSGYEPVESDLIDLVDKEEKTLDLDLVWKVWQDIVEPVKYNLSGVVTFASEGPKADLVAEGATITDGTDTITLGTDGKYFFILEEGTFSLTVTPAADDLGETGSKSGYLAKTETGTLSEATTLDIVLEYYTYTPIVTGEVDITSPALDQKFKVGDEITVTGTTDLPDGTILTVTIDTETGIATVSGGTWSVTMNVPDEPGSYQVIVENDEGTVSDDVIIEVEDKDDDKIDPAIIAAVVIVIIVLVIVIIILAVLMFRKKPAEEEEDEEGGEFECPECSALVSADVDTCPECGESFEEEEFRCPECGAKIEGESSSCDECGTEFEGTDEDEEELDEDEEEVEDEDEDEEEGDDEDEEIDEDEEEVDEEDDEDEEEEEEDEDFEVEIEEDDSI